MSVKKIWLPLLTLCLCFLPNMSANAASEVGFFEIASSDLSKSKAFYGQLFGWKFRETSKDFLMIENAGIPGGLVHDTNLNTGRANAKIFFKVDDLKAKLALAEKLGGKVITPPNQTPPSIIAEFRDLDENVVGMISTGHH